MWVRGTGFGVGLNEGFIMKTRVRSLVLTGGGGREMGRERGGGEGEGEG